MTFKKDICKIPNLVSATHVLITPVLFLFAVLQMEGWFLAVLVLSGGTDVLDGILAR